MILAIETATDACSVAIGDRARVHVDHRVVPRGHDRLVLRMIDELLASAGVARGMLTGLAIGCGPGSFTGVRIAASIAQGLALALDLRIARVSTLEILARGALRAVPAASGVVASIGATSTQRYLAAFAVRDGDLVRVAADRAVATTEPLPRAVVDGWSAAGPEAEQLLSRAREQGVTLTDSRLTHPSAADLLVLGLRELETGHGVDAQDALPVYLDGDGPWRRRGAS